MSHSSSSVVGGMEVISSQILHKITINNMKQRVEVAWKAYYTQYDNQDTLTPELSNQIITISNSLIQLSSETLNRLDSRQFALFYLPMLVTYHLQSQSSTNTIDLQFIEKFIQKAIDDIKRANGIDFQLVSDENTKQIENTIKLKTIIEFLLANLAVVMKLSQQQGKGEEGNNRHLYHLYVTFIGLIIPSVRKALSYYQNPKKVFLSFCQEKVMYQLLEAINELSQDDKDAILSSTSDVLQRLVQDVLFDEKHLFELAHTTYASSSTKKPTETTSADDTAVVVNPPTPGKKRKSMGGDMKSIQSYTLVLFDKLMAMKQLNHFDQLIRLLLRIYKNSSMMYAVNAKYEGSSKRFKENNNDSSISIGNRRRHLIRVIQFSLIIANRFLTQIQSPNGINDNESDDGNDFIDVHMLGSILQELSQSLGGSLPNHEDFDKHQTEMTSILTFLLSDLEGNHMNSNRPVSVYMDIIRHLADIDHHIVTSDNHCQRILSVISSASHQEGSEVLQLSISRLLCRIIDHYHDLRRMDDFIGIIRSVTITDTTQLYHFSQIFRQKDVQKSLMNAMLSIPLTDMLQYWRNILQSPQQATSGIASPQVFLYVLTISLAKAHDHLLSNSFVSTVMDSENNAPLLEFIDLLTIFSTAVELFTSQLWGTVQLTMFEETFLVCLNNMIYLVITMLSENNICFYNNLLDEEKTLALVGALGSLQANLSQIISQEDFLTAISANQAMNHRIALVFVSLQYDLNIQCHVSSLQQQHWREEEAALLPSSHREVLLSLIQLLNSHMEDSSSSDRELCVSIIMQVFQYAAVWHPLGIISKADISAWISFLITTTASSSIGKAAELYEFLSSLKSYPVFIETYLELLERDIAAASGHNSQYGSIVNLCAILRLSDIAHSAELSHAFYQLLLQHSTASSSSTAEIIPLAARILLLNISDYNASFYHQERENGSNAMKLINFYSHWLAREIPDCVQRFLCLLMDITTVSDLSVSVAPSSPQEEELCCLPSKEYLQFILSHLHHPMINQLFHLSVNAIIKANTAASEASLPEGGKAIFPLIQSLIDSDNISVSSDACRLLDCLVTVFQQSESVSITDIVTAAIQQKVSLPPSTSATDFHAFLAMLININKILTTHHWTWHTETALSLHRHVFSLAHQIELTDCQLTALLEEFDHSFFSLCLATPLSIMEEVLDVYISSLKATMAERKYSSFILLISHIFVGLMTFCIDHCEVVSDRMIHLLMESLAFLQQSILHYPQITPQYLSCLTILTENLVHHLAKVNPAVALLSHEHVTILVENYLLSLSNVLSSKSCCDGSQLTMLLTIYENLVNVLSMRSFLLTASLPTLMQNFQIIISRLVLAIDTDATGGKPDQQLTKLFTTNLPRIIMTLSKIRSLGNHIDILASFLLYVFTTFSYINSSNQTLHAKLLLGSGIQYSLFQLVDRCNPKEKKRIFTLLPDNLSRDYYRQFFQLYNTDYKYVGKA